MELLEYFFASPLYSILWLLQAGFTVWMLVDCYRRQADYIWYWIILTGVGAWAYFFAVKVRAGDFRGGGGLGGLFNRGPSLRHLRYLAEQTPTHTNHLNLA